MPAIERAIYAIRKFNGFHIPIVGDIRINGRLTDYAVLALFVGTTLWFFIIPFIGLAWSEDECYMALSCRNYTEQPIAMLSFYAGWVAMKVFGDQIITLRMLASVSYFIAIMIPCCYFLRKTGNRRWTMFLAVVCMALVRGREMNHYGWDAAPSALESALLMLCVLYVGNPSVRKACWTGAVLGLLILARVPAGLTALPICALAIVWGARRAGQGRRFLMRSLALGAVMMFAAMLICALVMRGSVKGYIDSWNADNIITGHGLKDLKMGFLDHAVDDLRFIADRYKANLPLILTIPFLLLLDRKSRLVPGAVMIVLLAYCKYVGRDSITAPHYFVPLALLLFPWLHNMVAKYIRRTGSIVKIDPAVIFLVISFAFVPAVGSDRFMVRLAFFYSLPILMVGLYPWRNGILKWIMAIILLPALLFSMLQRMNELRCMRPEDDRLPYHKWVREFYEFDEFVEPVDTLTDRLRSEGKRFSAFGSCHYAPIYLFGEGKPFKLNAFHYYYKNETLELLDMYTDSLDAILVRPDDLEAMTFTEIDSEFASRGFARTDSAGEYYVYEKIYGK